MGGVVYVRVDDEHFIAANFPKRIRRKKNERGRRDDALEEVVEFLCKQLQKLPRFKKEDREWRSKMGERLFCNYKSATELFINRTSDERYLFRLVYNESRKHEPQIDVFAFDEYAKRYLNEIL